MLHHLAGATIQVDNQLDGNQLTLICTTHVERMLSSIRCQKKVRGTDEFVTFSRMVLLSRLNIINVLLNLKFYALLH